MNNEYITDKIKYIGVDDESLDLFENQYILKNGMSYNSYLVDDEKTVVMDTVDKRKTNEWLDNLEFVLLGLPRPDYVLFLYLPYEYVCTLKEKRGEYANVNILHMAEIAYLELSTIYDYEKINCLDNNNLRTIEDIATEIKGKVKQYLEEGDEDEVK